MTGRTTSPPHAVLAVSDKTGIVDLGATLSELGWLLVATTGTAEVLHRHGISATTMTAFTGMPEMYGGRVKAFHPTIFGGILGRPGDPGATVTTSLALVVSNFYPLDPRLAESTEDPVLDSIDVGGPAMIAAAAKNHLRSIPLVEPTQYDGFAALLRSARGDPDAIPAPARRSYAGHAMQTLSSYYRDVARTLH